MFYETSVLLEAKVLEKEYFSRLERLWDSPPLSQRKQIEALTEQLKSDGIICSRYDFIEAVP